jgi:hypothetical protein
MQRDLIIVDNFYQNPGKIAAYALKSLHQRHCTPYNKPGDGKTIRWRTTWFQSAEQCPFKSSRKLIKKLQYLTGEKIDLHHWRLGYPIDENGRPTKNHASIEKTAWFNCCFHVKHPQAKGDLVHDHTDNDTWNACGKFGWAGLVYLNEDAPRDGGLCTWRHLKGRNEDRYAPKENWELVDSLANVYNRLILHRGCIPHSGSAGWGSTIEDGRLFQTFFFKTKPSQRNPLDIALE